MKPSQFAIIIAILALIGAGVWFPRGKRDGGEQLLSSTIDSSLDRRAKMDHREREEELQSERDSEVRNEKFTELVPLLSARDTMMKITRLEYPSDKEQLREYLRGLDGLSATLERYAPSDPVNSQVYLRCARLLSQGHTAITKCESERVERPAISNVKKAEEAVAVAMVEFNTEWPDASKALVEAVNAIRW